MSNGTDVNTIIACKRCKSKLVNGVKCKNCDNSYHISCAKISPNVKFSEDRGVITCCEKRNSDTDTDFYDAMEEWANTNPQADKRFDAQVFVYIIKQKDNLIEELRDKINLLHEQINLMKEVKEKTRNDVFRQSQGISKTVNTKTDSNLKKLDIHVGGVPDKKSEPKKEQIASKDVSAELLKIQSLVKCNEIINLANPSSSSSRIPLSREDEQQWEKVTSKRKSLKSRKMVVGNNKDSTIKGVRKHVQLHVCRIAPETSATDLEELLKHVFPEVRCDALTPKQPSIYASFKVTIFQDNFARAMDPQIWPDGAYISRFFQKRKIGAPVVK